MGFRGSEVQILSPRPSRVIISAGYQYDFPPFLFSALQQIWRHLILGTFPAARVRVDYYGCVIFNGYS